MKKQTVILGVAVVLCLCEAGIDAQPDCAKALLEPQPVREKFKDGIKYKDGSAIMCFDGKCDKISLDNVKEAYPDAFSSKKEAMKTTNLKYNAYREKVPTKCVPTKTVADSISSAAVQVISPVCRRFWNDKDRCCPTWRYVTFTRGPLTNVYGNQCYILQIPHLRLYQYISVGLCGWPQNCKKCKQEKTVQSMLAWCPGSPGIKMHHFNIPSYCSCQG